MLFLSSMSDEDEGKMRVSRNPGVYFANRLCPFFVERTALLAEVNARTN